MLLLCCSCVMCFVIVLFPYGSDVVLVFLQSCSYVVSSCYGVVVVLVLVLFLCIPSCSDVLIVLFLCYNCVGVVLFLRCSYGILVFLMIALCLCCPKVVLMLLLCCSDDVPMLSVCCPDAVSMLLLCSS